MLLPPRWLACILLLCTITLTTGIDDDGVASASVSASETASGTASRAEGDSYTASAKAADPFKNIFDHEKPSSDYIPRNLHFVWLGELNEATIDYMRVWRKINPNIDMTLWTDKEASLVNFLKNTISDYVESYVIEKDAAVYNIAEEKLQLRIKVQNDVWKFISDNLKTGLFRWNKNNLNTLIKKAIIKFGLIIDDEATTDAQRNSAMDVIERRCESSFKKGIMEELNVKVKQINPLFNSDKEMFKYYAQEIALRQSAAAASDLARIKLLLKKGGLYLDTDMLPGLVQSRVQSLRESMPVFESNPDVSLRALTQVILERLKSDGLQLSGRNDGRISTGMSDVHGKTARQYVDHLQRFEELGGDAAQLRLAVQDPMEWISEYRDIPVSSKTGSAVMGNRGNGVIASIRRSMGMQRVDEHVRRRYRYIEKTGIVHGDQVPKLKAPRTATDPVTFESHLDDWEDIMPKVKQRILANNKAESKMIYRSMDHLISLHEKFSRYRSDGFKSTAVATSTAYVSGPDVIQHVLRNQFDVLKSEVSFGHGRESNVYNMYTDEGAIHSWLNLGEANMWGVENFNNIRYVLTMGATASEEMAAQALIAKGNRKRKIDVQRGKYEVKEGDRRHAVFVTENGDVLSNPEREKVMPEIVIIGHGDGPTKTISGVSPEDVARAVRNTFGDRVTVAKISIVACNLADIPEVPNSNLAPKSFSRRFLSKLPENLRPRKYLSVRPGLVQVDELGNKYYKQIEPNGALEWKRENAVPNWERKTQKTVVEKSVIDGSWRARSVDIQRGEVLNREMDLKMSGELHSATYGMSDQAAETSKMMPRTISETAVTPFFGIPESGIIVTEPSVLAIVNAMRTTPQRIIVASSSARLLEGSRIAMNIIADSPNIPEAISRLSRIDDEIAQSLENSISILTEENPDALTLAHLVNRRNTDMISFVPIDLTSPAAADYLVSLQNPSEDFAAFFFGHELSENTLGPATRFQTQQFQKEAMTDTLASCLFENADLVVPGVGDKSTRLYRQADTASLYNSIEEPHDNIASEPPQFDVLNAHLLVDELDRAIWVEQVEKRLPADGYVPVIGSADDTQLQVIHRESLETKAIFPSNLNIFKKARAILESKADLISKTFRHSDDELVARPMPEGEPVTSLNSVFFIMAISHIAQFKPHANKNRTTLADAIFIQTWINFAGAGINEAHDVFGVFALLRVAMKTGQMQTISSTTKSLAQAVSRIGVASQVIGVGMNLVNIGFDIYELTQIRSAFNLTVIATHLAVDLSSLALSGGAIVAGLLGMSTLAGVLGAIAGPLIAIGIGINGLEEAFEVVRLHATTVGRHFADLDEAFKNVYTANQSFLIPNQLSVITELNFRTGTLKMGSQKLARSTLGHTGCGRINYYFWIGDMPKVDRVRPAFEIRERLGHRAEHDFDRSKTTIILPIAPVSTIGAHRWNILSTATTTHRPGFDVLRKLETLYDFHFDFYIFPWSWIIQKIHVQYEHTTVKITMDEIARTLIVPQHVGDQVNKLTYHVIGSSSRTVIVLEKNANYKLEGTESAIFLLDISKLGSLADIVKRSNRLVVGHQSIDVSLLKSESIWIRSQNTAASYNLETSDLENEEIDASRYNNTNDLRELLDKLAAKHHGTQQLVHVSHFIVANGNQVTYDPSSHRFIYTDPDIAPKDEYVLLLDNNIAWLTSPTTKALWTIDVGTHHVVRNLTLASSLWTGYNGAVMSVKKIGALFYITDRIPNHYWAASITFYNYMFSNEVVRLTSASVEFDAAPPHSSLNETRLFGWIHDKDYLNRTDITHIRLAQWLDIKAFVYSRHGNATCTVRKWTNTETNHSVKLYAPPMSGAVLMRLTIVPELSIHKTLGHVFRILLHDQVEKNLYRYTKRHIEVIHNGISQVIQEGDRYVGSTVRGEVIELPLTGSGTLVGYTREGLHFFGRQWWEIMQYNSSYSSRIPLALYGVHNETQGDLQPTLLTHARVRAWYIPRYRKFAVFDPSQFNDEDFHFIDSLNDGSGALFRTNCSQIKVVKLVEDGSTVFTETGELKATANYSSLNPWLPVEALGKVIESRHIQQTLVLQTDVGILVGIENTTTKSATLTVKGIHVSDATMLPSVYDLVREMPLNKPIGDFIPTWTGTESGWAYTLSGSIGPFFVDNLKVHGIPLGTDIADRTKLWSFGGNNLYETKDGVTVRYKHSFTSVSRVDASMVLTISSLIPVQSVPILTGVTNVAVVLNRYTLIYIAYTEVVNVKQFTVVLSQKSNKTLFISVTPWERADVTTSIYKNIVEVRHQRTGQTVSVMNYYAAPDLVIFNYCDEKPYIVFQSAKNVKSQYKLMVTGISFPGCTKQTLPNLYPGESGHDLNSKECNPICTCDDRDDSRDHCIAESDQNKSRLQCDEEDKCGNVTSCIKSNLHRNCDPYLELTLEDKPGCQQRTIVRQNVYDWNDDRDIVPVCNNSTAIETYMVLDVTDIMEDADSANKMFTITMYDDSDDGPRVLCKFTKPFDILKQKMRFGSMNWLEPATLSTLGGKCNLTVELVSCFAENKLDVIAITREPGCNSKDAKSDTGGFNADESTANGQCCGYEVSIHNEDAAVTSDKIAQLVLTQIPLQTNHHQSHDEVCAYAARRLMSLESAIGPQTSSVIIFELSLNDQACSRNSVNISLTFNETIDGSVTAYRQSIDMERIKSSESKGYQLSIPGPNCSISLAYHSCHVPHVHYILAIELIHIEGCNKVKYRDPHDNAVKDSAYCHCNAADNDIIAGEDDAYTYACDVYIEATMDAWSANIVRISRTLSNIKDPYKDEFYGDKETEVCLFAGHDLSNKENTKHSNNPELFHTLVDVTSIFEESIRRNEEGYLLITLTDLNRGRLFYPATFHTRQLRHPGKPDCEHIFVRRDNGDLYDNGISGTTVIQGKMYRCFTSNMLPTE